MSLHPLIQLQEVAPVIPVGIPPHSGPPFVSVRQKMSSGYSMQSIRTRLGLTFTANRSSACPDHRNNRNNSRRMGESLHQLGGKYKEKTSNGNGQPEGHPRPPFDGPAPKDRNAKRTINENGQPVKASRFRTLTFGARTENPCSESGGLYDK